MQYIQNILSVSKKHPFFRAPLTKIQASKQIIFGHRLAIILLPSTSQRTNVCLSQKGVTCSEIARGHFLKITETARLPGTEFGTDKSTYGSYITCQ